jgi:hypothetical protein
MPISIQPELSKAIKFRTRLKGQYGLAADGLLLNDDSLIQEGETKHITFDCQIELIKGTIAYATYNPMLYVMGTVTGPTILLNKHNEVSIRIEADEDTDLSLFDYVVKVSFESIF